MAAHIVINALYSQAQTGASAWVIGDQMPAGYEYNVKFLTNVFGFFYLSIVVLA